MPGHYVAPELRAPAFTCPRCGTFSTQSFNPVYVGYEVAGTWATLCSHCGRSTFWESARTPDGNAIGEPVMVYPPPPPIATPNEDMSNEIKADFNEAADIFHRSPRGAAALLRLCVQKLCKELGLPGEHIDQDIASLVKAGLDPELQQMMDIVRITGNEAVHPGTLDLHDTDKELVVHLFALVNEIADQMITRPKRTAALYARMPQSKRDAIAKRDAGTAQP